MSSASLAGGLGIARGAAGPGARVSAGQEEEEETVFHMIPVGAIQKRDDATRIRIHEEYANALLGLDGWSHVNVLYWFDRNDVPERRSILRVHPRGDRENPLTGVFACRAPVRPNLIALSVCRILGVEGDAITIDDIDAFDGTPVVDLKPFIPPDLPAKDVRVPEWVRSGR